MTPAYVTLPLLLTLKVALGTLLLHIFVGIALAWYLSKGGGWLRRFLDMLISLPLLFPPIVIGLFLLYILGKHSPLGIALKGVGIEVVFTPFGVLIASFIAGLPLVVKPIQASFCEQDGIYSEASYVLGKGEFETFLRVILPCSFKVILASLFLGLARSLGEVGITLMLGGNIINETDTMSLAIYNHAFSGEMDKALVLSLTLGLFSLAIFALLSYQNWDKARR
ncbi:MAG: molybdate ABC transporter permease subunit [Wolinella sp.]